MTTTADEKIEHAKNKLAEAYKDLLTVLDEDTYGHNEYGSEYIDTIQEVAMELLKLKRRL